MQVGEGLAQNTDIGEGCKISYGAVEHVVRKHEPGK